MNLSRPLVDPDTLRRYQQHRAKGYPAYYFKAQERRPFCRYGAPVVGGHNVIQEATWMDEHGFRYLAQVVADEACDATDLMADLGEAVDSGKFPDVLPRSRKLLREPRYFRPFTSIKEEDDGWWWRGYSKAESYRKALAAAYAKLKRFEDYGDGWIFTGVVVYCYEPSAFGIPDIDDHEKSLSSDSIWGVESDVDNEYLLTLTQDLQAEAFSTARAVLGLKIAEKIAAFKA